MVLNALSDEYFMNEAIKEANKAFIENEVPIGAVVVLKDRIISRGYNQTEKLNDVTAHAEIIAITSACNFLGSKYLKDCTLYVTLEPCVMCAGAIAWSQINRVVYAASDNKKGYSVFNKNIILKKTQITSDILSEESTNLINTFFKNKR